MGTVVTAPGATAPTTFTMNVTGAGSTTILYTVKVSTATTLYEAGTGSPSPSLSGILAGDEVWVYGAQDGAHTVDATSVRVLPADGSYGGMV